MNLQPGDQLTIEWVVIGHSNAATDYGYPIVVDVFVAPAEDAYSPDDDGYVALLVEQDWLDAHPNEPGTGAECEGYAAHFIDGTVVDRTDPTTHRRVGGIERLEVQP